jgi:hypothetical protein
LFDQRLLSAPLVSFGHCIVGLSLFDERLLNAPLVSFGHCIVGLSLFDHAKKALIEQRQTDNTMAKRYQRDAKKALIEQRQTDNTMVVLSVCLCSMSAFLAPLWFLLAIVLSVCLCSISAFLAPLWFLLASVLSVCLSSISADRTKTDRQYNGQKIPKGR